jgi:hypothetical protein
MRIYQKHVQDDPTPQRSRRIAQKAEIPSGARGFSLSAFLLKEIEQVVNQPTLQEIADRIATRTAVKYKVSPADILREERSRR